jgi:hypothetical protein
MSYSKFTSLAKFCQQYNLKQNSTSRLFVGKDIEPCPPSKRLEEDLEEAKMLPLYTEKAKSELVITPLLKEVKRNNPFITFFSGFALNINEELSGNPDYVLSAKPDIIEIQAPIFCLFESKNKAPEEGFGQCAAEMYASRLFNQENKEPYLQIYGAVTNAYDWVFMKLDADTIFIDTERYFLNDLPTLLGVMQYIINQYKPNFT